MYNYLIIKIAFFSTAYQTFECYLKPEIYSDCQKSLGDNNGDKSITN